MTWNTISLFWKIQFQQVRPATRTLVSSEHTTRARRSRARMAATSASKCSLPRRNAEDGQVVAVHPILDGRGQRRIIAGHRTARAPANSQTPRNGPAPGRTGDVVALRSLAFYDAVGKRLAHKGTAA